MATLLLLFILVPAVELALLIEVGSRIGTLPTLALIVLTGIVGASLARLQGFAVLRKIQADVAQGQLPAGSLVDGVIILLAGALLITPGILTDVLGLVCLVPAFRTVVKSFIWRRIERAVSQSQVHVSVYGQDMEGPTSPGAGTGPVYDIRPEPEKPDSC
ncbi:MAG: FxsA family protein [Acidobacteriota bacterium]